MSSAQAADFHLLNVEAVHQESPRACGAACLEMVLRYWGQSVPQQTIMWEVDQNHPSGLAAKDIKRLAENRGFRAFIVRGTTDDLFNYLARGIPLIVARRARFARGIGNHYMVAVGYSKDKDYLSLCDPDKGRIRVRLDDFLAGWSDAKRFLMIVSPRDRPVEGRSPEQGQPTKRSATRTST